MMVTRRLTVSAGALSQLWPSAGVGWNGFAEGEEEGKSFAKEKQ